MIEALTEESSKARRRTHANTAYTALRQMQAAMPPANADEAKQRGWEQGWVSAMALLRQALADVGDPMRRASYAENARNAYGAINALLHYADTVVTEFEKRATRAMREPPKETT
jgi:hypothetical protein